MSDLGIPQQDEPVDDVSSLDFIKGFVRLCDGTEIPPLFAMWSAIGAISCALGRRLWLDMGTYTIYPNMYVVLVAGSGRYRKSTSINQAKKIIRELAPKPNLIAQKVTPEALIEAIRTISVNPEKLLAEEATGFVLVDELSTFLNRSSYESGLAPLLIQFFDCEDFEYRTKSRGVEVAKNTCLGMLGASTVDWIRSAIPEDAVGGGLTSRMIFVYVNTPTKPVAITSFSQEKRLLLDRLIKQLTEISSYSGAITLTPDAWKRYESTYNRFYETSPFYDEKNLSGYASRRHMHWLKVALAFCVAKNQSRMITVEHLEAAERVLIGAEATMSLVLDLITATDAGNATGMILNVIRNRKTVSRSQLLSAVAHRISARELTDIVDTLIAMGSIEMVPDPQFKGVNYRFVRDKTE